MGHFSQFYLFIFLWRFNWSVFVKYIFVFVKFIKLSAEKILENENNLLRKAREICQSENVGTMGSHLLAMS